VTVELLCSDFIVDDVSLLYPVKLLLVLQSAVQTYESCGGLCRPI